MEAASIGEVPVAALLVKDEVCIARAHNQPIKDCDPSAHAEMRVLRAAAKTLNNYRLQGCTLYCTLEPCAMCVGALVHARIDRLVFAALDPKAGAVCSAIALLDQPFFNHRIAWHQGVLAEQAGWLLRDFFQRRRTKKTKGFVLASE